MHLSTRFIKSQSSFWLLVADIIVYVNVCDSFNNRSITMRPYLPSPDTSDNDKEQFKQMRMRNYYNFAIQLQDAVHETAKEIESVQQQLKDAEARGNSVLADSLNQKLENLEVRQKAMNAELERLIDYKNWHFGYLRKENLIKIGGGVIAGALTMYLAPKMWAKVKDTLLKKALQKSGFLLNETWRKNFELNGSFPGAPTPITVTGSGWWQTQNGKFNETVGSDNHSSFWVKTIVIVLLFFVIFIVIIGIYIGKSDENIERFCPFIRRYRGQFNLPNDLSRNKFLLNNENFMFPSSYRERTNSKLNSLDKLETPPHRSSSSSKRQKRSQNFTEITY